MIEKTKQKKQLYKAQNLEFLNRSGDIHMKVPIKQVSLSTCIVLLHFYIHFLASYNVLDISTPSDWILVKK